MALPYNFLHFLAVFGEIRPNNRLAPPSRKSWIRRCRGLSRMSQPVHLTPRLPQYCLCWIECQLVLKLEICIWNYFLCIPVRFELTTITLKNQPWVGDREKCSMASVMPDWFYFNSANLSDLTSLLQNGEYTIAMMLCNFGRRSVADPEFHRRRKRKFIIWPISPENCTYNK